MQRKSVNCHEIQFLETIEENVLVASDILKTTGLESDKGSELERF